MEPFDWSDGYAVGQPDIDKEHRALFRIAADLHEAMTAGRARAELGSLFARLTAYTRFHFSNEEALLRAQESPDLEDHLREHRQLAGKIADLESRFQSGTAEVDTATMIILRRWLTNHILGTDRSLA